MDIDALAKASPVKYKSPSKLLWGIFYCLNICGTLFIFYMQRYESDLRSSVLDCTIVLLLMAFSCEDTPEQNYRIYVTDTTKWIKNTQDTSSLSLIGNRQTAPTYLHALRLFMSKKAEFYTCISTAAVFLFYTFYSRFVIGLYGLLVVLFAAKFIGSVEKMILYAQTNNVIVDAIKQLKKEQSAPAQ